MIGIIYGLETTWITESLHFAAISLFVICNKAKFLAGKLLLPRDMKISAFWVHG